LDEMLAGDLGQHIDDQRIGLIGWSFGGWAVLATLEVDDRVRAVVALAPAGNSKPLPGIIPATLTCAWKREVPTLFLVAERDRFTPLAGQYELFERAPSGKRMFILRHADHGHFADEIDEHGLCPPERAHLFTSALSLAHLNAALKTDPAAERFLDNDPVARLRDHGVDAIVYPSSVAD
jgi:dienelactone hydrolase